jgi:TIR domain
MSIGIRPRLFLSYARVDREAADQLETHLREAGSDVWMDRQELLTGDNFVAGLERELSNCHGLVLLLTQSSAISNWCMAELQRALAQRLPTNAVQYGPQEKLQNAIERLLRDSQQLEWGTGARLTSGSRLREARKRRMRFEGEFWATWLRNNHFEDCVFFTKRQVPCAMYAEIGLMQIFGVPVP